MKPRTVAPSRWDRQRRGDGHGRFIHIGAARKYEKKEILCWPSAAGIDEENAVVVAVVAVVVVVVPLSGTIKLDAAISNVFIYQRSVRLYQLSGCNPSSLPFLLSFTSSMLSKEEHGPAIDGPVRVQVKPR